ncbi:MAG: hypothetical protein JJ926_13820 [Roseitalea sp.]|jgi:hypothetical protein|uniref:Uncharacterized protein n=2 Tax=Oceaniradius stylonematis TaxID=2184161 RepID=A0A3A8ABV7_9HYPH|nr:hypothetical protein [Oceaniradius stylonematis]MBO6554134.1 hypothetical protein [Roseitalea sp.]MBO6953178.1 hypothetical protein [Rhizobiaceae bacterium]RNC91149.1 MAG: hypothetical protein ED558_14475 [Oricola sp.]MBO6593525.1 hypothetical protein [Roseitalea sp.]MBO6600921.1 hypothetical protein [Roseitalea sp.]
MAFEGLITRLNMLFQEMENQPADATELLMQVHLELEQMKAEGLPLPQDLVDLEKRLEAEFTRRGVDRPA